MIIFCYLMNINQFDDNIFLLMNFASKNLPFKRQDGQKLELGILSFCQGVKSKVWTLQKFGLNMVWGFSICCIRWFENLQSLSLTSTSSVFSHLVPNPSHVFCWIVFEIELISLVLFIDLPHFLSHSPHSPDVHST